MRQSLSVVILTKNDEERIAECLESVKWADEIVIVDDCSIDKTIDICKQYGAKVIVHKMEEARFDEQKNLGVKNAIGDWILQLDSDEIVSKKLKEEIIEVLHSSKDFAAYSFIWKLFFLGRYLKSADEIHTRFFKKGKARFVNKLHERLEVNGQIGFINAEVEHYSYNSISQFIQKNNLYTSIEAKVMWEEKGMIPINEIRYNLTIKPLKLFWKLYIRKKGYKDGFYGLVWCILNVIRRIMIWAKYWELVKENKPVNLHG